MTDARNDADTAAAAGRDAADRMSEAAHKAGEQFRAGAERAREGFQDHVVEPARRAGEAIRASGERIAENSSAIGVTIIDQVETNANEAFAALRAAAKARDLTEVMKIQGDYLRGQGQRSITQAREIGELIMQFGRQAVTPPRDAARPGGEAPGRE